MSTVELLEEVLRNLSTLMTNFENFKREVQDSYNMLAQRVGELRELVQQVSALIQQREQARTAEREQRLLLDMLSISRSLSTSVSKLEASLTAHREFISNVHDMLSNITSQLATFVNELKDVKTLLLVYTKEVEVRFTALLHEVSKYREDISVLIEDLKLEIRKLRESIDTLRELLTTLFSKSSSR